MIKRGEIIAIAVILVLASLNVYLFVNKGDFSYSALSGMIVKEQPKSVSFSLSIFVFVIQWVFFILLLIFLFLRHIKKNEKEKSIIQKVNLNEIKSEKNKAKTDFDILYNLLKEKKRLTIRMIAKLFNISNEKALDWAKILEDHDLATIEYSTFNDPELRIKE